MGRYVLLSGVIAIVACAIPAAAAARQGVLQEVWTGVPGETVADLTASARFGQPADQVRLLDALETDSLGSEYGTRLTTLLTPPRSGKYTFYIASDDGGELWLGTGPEPASTQLIARVDGYSAPRAWTATPEQRSKPVRLMKGKQYYLEALMKQGGGENHLAIAWEGPGLECQLIAGPALTLPTMTRALQAAVRATLRDDDRRARQLAEAARFWKVGKTLPVQYAQQFPVGGTPDPATDTGINVLIDQAHQTQFAVIWGFNGLVASQGFRTCSSLASLDTVLEPGRLSRIRLPMNDMEPFAWWPTPEWNVVVTSQQDLNAQVYTEAERAALRRFVESGGGLMVFAGAAGTEDRAATWSLNAMLGDFGAKALAQPEALEGRRYAALELGPEWTVLVQGDGGRPVRAQRAFGKGRVLICEGSSVFTPDDKLDSAAVSAQKVKGLRDLLLSLAAGKPPVGGEGRMAGAGGAGIYPELELNVGGIVVYYAANQPPATLECIQKSIPTAAERILQWLPTQQFEEPYSLVICAGGGGGWAINSRPKASAVIEYEPLSILGVFGHEFAHTMSGPRNARGELAGYSPHGNQGESHAGWFQGKVNALFNPPDQKLSNRNCNSVLELETKKGDRLDLATEDETEAGREKWGYGPGWTKEWWVFQKRDDRFGPTWYPRWYWVRATRWADEPGHQETWDEMVEDMSIAVGEDLFPFYRKIGTSLTRERLERIEFQGQMLELPVCPLEDGPAGNVCLDPVGDYTRPLTPR